MAAAMHMVRESGRAWRHLPTWVLASVLAHAALMVAWTDARLLTASGGQPGGPLAVSIERPAPADPPSRRTEDTPPAERRMDTPQREEKTRKNPPRASDDGAGTETAEARSSRDPLPVSSAPEATTRDRSEPKRHAPAPKGKARDGSPSDSRPPTDAAARQAPAQASDDARPSVDVDAARDAVRLRLTRHFEYPRLARRRGWEGRVIVDFRLTPEGRLRDARVVEGSGHAMLDRAALEALRRVERVPEARELLQGQAVRLRLPVIYRLRG